MDTTWQYRSHSKVGSLVCLGTLVKSPASNCVARPRIRPTWLHLIAIFFSKKMLYAAVQYSLAAGVMFQYHAHLGFHLLLLAACMDYV